MDALLQVDVRRVEELASHLDLADSCQEGRCELDSHADTIVAGNNCVVLELTGKTVSVTPFSEEYSAIKDVPVASVATAYDDPKTGQVYILVFHEALYFGERMNHTLLCPNQLRDHDIIVDDTPRQYDPASTHSIYVSERDLRIPLSLTGIISGFNSRQPTMAELANFELHVEMSSDLEWDPHSITFASAEEEITGTDDERKRMYTRRQVQKVYRRHLVSCFRTIQAMSKSVELRSAEHAFEESNDWLARRLISAARVEPKLDDDIRASMQIIIEGSIGQVAAIRSGDPRSELTPENLARKWGIGLSTAHRTLKVTTQMGVRRLVHPAQRRFHTAMPHLRYPRLPGCRQNARSDGVCPGIQVRTCDW